MVSDTNQCCWLPSSSPPQGDKWYATCDVDLPALNGLLLLSLQVLHKMQRHQSLLALGAALQVCMPGGQRQ